MVDDPTTWVDEFSDEFEDLETSRSTTLEVIGRPGSERDWQNLLAYFLDPNESHSLGTTVLEAFTEVISSHSETDAPDLSTHLDSVTVETEVSAPPKRFADLLIWAQGEWFICIELKVDSHETGDQTVRYVQTPRLGSLVKAKHETQGGESQYVYLAPDGATSPEHSGKFLEVSWREVIIGIETQLAADGKKSPSHAQLFDFLQTIKKHLTMDEFNKVSEEARLYAEYKSEMKKVRREYENELNRLKDMMEEALETEFQAPEWRTHHRDGRTTWTQLYKSSWHNDAFHVEYEPHFKMGKSPPQIQIALDIEKGSKRLKIAVRDYLTDHLDDSVVEEQEWIITGDVKPCLTKSIFLDVESPRASIEDAVQAIRVFDTAVGDHIDDAVAANIPDSE